MLRFEQLKQSSAAPVAGALFLLLRGVLDCGWGGDTSRRASTCGAGIISPRFNGQDGFFLLVKSEVIRTSGHQLSAFLETLASNALDLEDFCVLIT